MSMIALTNSWSSLKVLNLELLAGAKGKEVGTISVETFVVEDFSSHLNRSLAKFCLHFVGCILTDYLHAWRLRISSAASTLLR